ncbi:hypothetical protein BM221_010755 [Beauveria bassiana]|uniref:Uncharacterized protein n=1 Tax=Beauveria bassiana TaxID=176275 RepID=A0A2N6N805_BEABA|nr:hypothetical protein BM221_010755 [Beauveria bassiana]
MIDNLGHRYLFFTLNRLTTVKVAFKRLLLLCVNTITLRSLSRNSCRLTHQRSGVTLHIPQETPSNSEKTLKTTVARARPAMALTAAMVLRRISPALPLILMLTLLSLSTMPTTNTRRSLPRRLPTVITLSLRHSCNLAKQTKARANLPIVHFLEANRWMAA